MDTQSAVTKVEFSVDGVLKATDTTAPWTAKINSKLLGGGPQARAFDAAGNVRTPTTVSVTTR